MLRDGIYRIHYPAEFRSPEKIHTALASFRGGQIFGSDEFGGIYHGHQQRGPGQIEQPVTVAVKMPPNGRLITGHEAEDGPVVIEMPNALEPCSYPHAACVHVNGVPVEIEICYLGPLPA